MEGREEGGGRGGKRNRWIEGRTEGWQSIRREGWRERGRKEEG